MHVKIIITLQIDNNYLTHTVAYSIIVLSTNNNTVLYIFTHVHFTFTNVFGIIYDVESTDTDLCGIISAKRTLNCFVSRSRSASIQKATLSLVFASNSSFCVSSARSFSTSC